MDTFLKDQLLSSGVEAITESWWRRRRGRLTLLLREARQREGLILRFTARGSSSDEASRIASPHINGFGPSQKQTERNETKCLHAITMIAAPKSNHSSTKVSNQRNDGEQDLDLLGCLVMLIPDPSRRRESRARFSHQSSLIRPFGKKHRRM